MNQERLMNILQQPHISEKSVLAADKNRQYVFIVANDATKPEIKKAVQLMFKVDVEQVQVLNRKGKTKRFGQRMGKRSNTKKAFVSLKEGQEIQFAGAE